MLRGPQAPTLHLRVIGSRTIGVSGLPPADLVDLLTRSLPFPVVVESGDELVEDDALSERERDVVRLITLGATNNDIADHMFLSLNTVKTYIRSAYRKMGVSSRSEAVMWGVRRGLDVDRRVAGLVEDDAL